MFFFQILIGLKRKKYISLFVIIKGLFVTLDDNENTHTHTQFEKVVLNPLGNTFYQWLK